MTEQANEQGSSDFLFGKMIITGFIGGIIWSAFLSIMYYFNFSEVAPKTFILNPWSQSAWIDKWQGYGLAILLSGLISLLPSVLYYFSLRRIYSMWIGVFYGVVLWVILFFLLSPFLNGTRPVMDLKLETIIATIGVFILYGTFIGYSISFHDHEQRIKRSQRNEQSVSEDSTVK